MNMLHQKYHENNFQTRYLKSKIEGILIILVKT